MKVFAVIFIAAFAAYTNAAPATQAVDWDAVANKVAEIESTVHQAGQQIVDIASNENEEVGSNIENKARQAAVPATGILQQAKDAVDAQTLTVGLSRQLTGDLKAIFGKLLGDIQPELNQLLPITEYQIRATFVATIKVIEVQADELSTLLLA